jgi:SsrA-binding protein
MARKAAKKKSGTILATNRSARHEFELLDSYEAGIVLTGTEVKSARQGAVNIKDAYAKLDRGELYLFNAHISPYAQGNRENVDPVRPRKLLVHARELRKLARATETTSMTIIPTRMYLRDGWIKVEVAVARGKKLHDKREATRRREMEREMERSRAVR